MLWHATCRSDQVVNDSSGMPRPDTGGGATRKLFMQLPGVGAKTAKIWFDLGYRYVWWGAQNFADALFLTTIRRSKMTWVF